MFNRRLTWRSIDVHLTQENENTEIEHDLSLVGNETLERQIFVIRFGVGSGAVNIRRSRGKDATGFKQAGHRDCGKERKCDPAAIKEALFGIRIRRKGIPMVNSGVESAPRAPLYRAFVCDRIQDGRNHRRVTRRNSRKF